MTQSNFVIADGYVSATFPIVQAMLQALASNSLGTTAPSTTYAGQFWLDTTANELKMRNAANSAWILVGTFDFTAGTFNPAITAIDGVPIGATTPSTIKGTTGSFSGQVTVPNASADTSAVARGQVKPGLPVGANNAGSGTAISATTTGLTALSDGYAIMRVTGYSSAANLSGPAISASLSAVTTIAAQTYYGLFTGVYLLNMASGQSSTFSATVNASASANLSVVIDVKFVPTP